MSIQGVGLQVLETVHIISTTKNLDTIKGRYELLLERINTLRKAESNSQYSADINTSIETYQSMYYDRPLQDFELSAILKPNNFNTNDFYCEALVACMKRFTEGQLSEMSSLKSENAKIKRKVKGMEKIQLAMAELENKCSSASAYLSAINSLEHLQSNLS